MKILLSNDDGYDASGLLMLHKAVSQVAEVTVVALKATKVVAAVNCHFGSLFEFELIKMDLCLWMEPLQIVCILR